jgi:peptide/nickel transport system substrate-binding protein
MLDESRVPDHGLSRRDLFRRAGAVALAGAAASLLAACGGAAPTGGAASAATASGKASPSGAAGGPVRGGTLKVAEISDPPTLDVHQTTAVITQDDTINLYEPLFALDAQYLPQPLLATGFSWSNGNKTLTIPLRTDVQFHDGSGMTADDVVASLRRWFKIGTYGQQVGASVADVKATDSHTVVIDLKSPSGALLTYLANPNNMAAIMPKKLIDKFGDKPITDPPIGTGPFMYKDWKPNAYLKLARWDKYKPLSGVPSGMAGPRVAYVDEIDILPVPQSTTRLAGLQSGEYHFGANMDGDEYSQVTGTPGLVPEILKPDQWYIHVFNNKQGIFSNLKARQAYLKAISNKPVMEAAFGPQAFWSVDSPTLAYGAFTDDDDGKGVYNTQDIAGAQQLLKEINYDGTPIRLMTTQNYAWMYKGAVVAQSQLEKAGFKVKLNVVDWATLVAQRNNPAVYDVFTTGVGSPVYPSLGLPFLSPTWPGFWADPKMVDLTKQFLATVSLSDRQALWKQMQQLYYQDVPSVKMGDYYGFHVARAEVKGYSPNPAGLFFWNVWLAKQA